MSHTPTVYADHAATTPQRECAIAAYLEHAGLLNPGGQYAAGRAARKVLETAREEIAQLLGAQPIEVIFCGSGTEADNLGVRGLVRALDATHLVASPLEHPAVAKAVEAAETQQPLQHIALAIDPAHARVDATQMSQLFANFADTDRVVATMMLANNETGAIQPVHALVDALEQSSAQTTAVHCDAVQAVGHIPVNFADLGVTTLAASAHKFGGPRGMGLLLAKRSPAPQPVIVGGGQERGLRSGTPDVAAAAATAAALKEAIQELDTEAQRLSTLRNQLREHIATTIDNVVFFTPQDNTQSRYASGMALPGHLHLAVPGAEGDSLIMLLDSMGIAASTGSACAAGVNRASDTLLAMGVEEKIARGALRFSFGRTTTEEDIARIMAALPEVVERARLAGMA